MRNKRFPNYPDDTDYTTNAPSYYEDLARKEKLIRLLAERIWGYEKILDETLEQIQERFRAWDKNLEDFPEDVKVLLQQWLDDGTLDHIINDTIFNWKLDTVIFEQFRDSTTAQLQQTVQIMDNQENKIVYGMWTNITGTLSVTILSGKAYLDGKTILTPAIQKTFNPNTDTYIDLKPDGVFTYKEVANGGIEPPVDSGSIRTCRVITNATQVIESRPSDSNTFFGTGSGNGMTSGWKNTFYGYNAGLSNTSGSYNDFFGYFAGHLNTTGTHNTFIGYGSGRGNKTGQFNTFLGFQSGHLNESGMRNIAIGNNALEANLSGQMNVAIGNESAFKTTGSFNVMIGESTGKNNTTGANNVFIGVQAGSANTTASNNTFIGYQAGLLSTGTWNTAIGASALSGNTSGYLNTAIGYNAGKKITTGLQNTFIGNDAGNGANQSELVANSTAIGFGANTTRSNSVRLGNDGVNVVETNGDFETLSNGKGLILRSPDGVRYRVTVANGGEISVVNY